MFYEAIKDIKTTIFAEVQQAYSCRLHFHRAFELCYIMEGAALCENEGEIFVADTDHIVFSHCYHRHRSFDRMAHKKIVIAVPENLSHDISRLFSFSTLPPLLPDKALNRTLLPHFIALTRVDDSTPELLIKGYVNIIFGTLAAHYKNVSIEPTNKNISFIVKVLEYIDKHASEKIDLESISSEFGYNKSYFSRIFNDCVGISLSNYINSVRLDHFSALCKEKKDEKFINLIYEAGFQSASTFYRAKKQREAENKL